MTTAANHPITKQDYLRMRSRLSFRQVFWPTGLVLMGDAVLLLAAVCIIQHSLPTLNTPLGFCVYAFGQLLLVLIFFHNFAILHDCGHGNCSSREWVNSLIGHVTSVFCFMPYFPWKYIHAEHHTWAGNVQRDPTLRLVRDYETSQRARNWLIRVAWHTWIPLLALMQHVVFWTYPFVLRSEGRLRGKRLRGAAGSVTLLVIVYGMLAWFCGSWFNLRTFGPALVIYLVVVELINFPHHMGTRIFENTQRGAKLPLWAQNEVTRSCYYPPMISNLFFLNFNFHIEHHLFPDLPWHRLRGARAIAQEALGSAYIESRGIEWSLKNRPRNPAEVFLCDLDGRNSHPALEHPTMDEAESDEDYVRFLREVRLAQTEMLVNAPTPSQATNLLKTMNEVMS